MPNLAPAIPVSIFEWYELLVRVLVRIFRMSVSHHFSVSGGGPQVSGLLRCINHQDPAIVLHNLTAVRVQSAKAHVGQQQTQKWT